MQAVASGRGWTAELQRLPPCPVVSLEGGWEAYLARLEKKQRHELRRKLRRADDHPEKVEMRIVSPAQDVGSEMESFLGLMALGDAKARFLQPAMRRQFVALTHEAHRCGCLNLAFLDVGGVPAAAYWSFDYGNRLWVYNSGLNPAYSSLSPGWVLLGRLIQWAIDAGRTELDFLRGDEDYKYRLGGVERAIFRLTLMR
jgi:CelD/BcsL family acetyltransferase involved in cellulose biosynthesis